MPKVDVFEGLRKAIQEGDENSAERWANKAVELGIDPLKAWEAITEAIRAVGEDFGKGVCFLPELVGAGNAVQRTIPILRMEMSQTKAG